MLDSIYKKLEVELLYGNKPLATVDTVTSQTQLIMLASDFAAGIFSGGKGMQIDIYTANLATRRTSGGPATIKSVNLTTKTIEIEAAPAGTIAQGDVIIPYNSKDKRMNGMQAIMENVGTMFGINGADFEMWQGTVHEAVAGSATVALSMKVIQEAITKAVEKGLDKDVVVLCNPGHWDDLMAELTATRRFDGSYSSFDFHLSFHGMALPVMG